MYRTLVPCLGSLSNIPLISSDWYHMHGSRENEHCMINIIYVANYIFVLTINDVAHYPCCFSPLIYRMYSYPFLFSYFHLCNFMQIISKLIMRSDRYCFVDDGIIGLFSLFCFLFCVFAGPYRLLVLFRFSLWYCNIRLGILCYTFMIF